MLWVWRITGRREQIPELKFWRTAESKCRGFMRIWRRKLVQELIKQYKGTRFYKKKLKMVICCGSTRTAAYDALNAAVFCELQHITSFHFFKTQVRLYIAVFWGTATYTLFTCFFFPFYTVSVMNRFNWCFY